MPAGLLHNSVDNQDNMWITGEDAQLPTRSLWARASTMAS